MATPGPHLGHTTSPGGAEMGMWSEVNNAPEGRGERISTAMAGLTGSERRRRRNEGVAEYADHVDSMRTARGGSTSAPTKKLSWSERRAADKILKAGKQPRGKK